MNKKAEYQIIRENIGSLQQTIFLLECGPEDKFGTSIEDDVLRDLYYYLNEAWLKLHEMSKNFEEE